MCFCIIHSIWILSLFRSMYAYINRHIGISFVICFLCLIFICASAFFLSTLFFYLFHYYLLLWPRQTRVSRLSRSRIVFKRKNEKDIQAIYILCLFIDLFAAVLFLYINLPDIFFFLFLYDIYI